jgi:hypothetical protein
LLAAGVVLACDHRGLGHGWLSCECGLDLPQLNAEATQLDLVVQSPQKLEAALGEVPDQVPGLVQPLPGGLTEGMRKELLRRQVRTVKIIPCQPIATDIKLPRHPNGHRAELAV